MSHWVKTKCEVKDKSLLLKALEHMGLKYEEGTFVIEQYGSKEKAEILLAADRDVKGRNALGLSLQEDGTWAMVGDPYHAAGNHPLRKYYGQGAKFATDLALAYTVVDAKERLQEQGFEAVDNENAVVGPDGKIRMTYQKVMG